MSLLNSFSVFLVVLGLYIVATLGFCLRVIFDQKIFSTVALRSTLLAFVLHSTILANHFIKVGYPFLVGGFETLQLTSLCIVLVFICLCLFYRFQATGLVLIPLSLIFYVSSLTRSDAYRVPGYFFENPWAFVHLVFIFMSMAIFMVSFVIGLTYLFQEYRIKHKMSGGFFDRFPALETMDQIHYRALWIGFLFFTIGIITGAGWSKSTVHLYVTTNVKQILSFLVWIFFAIFLNLRVSKGWVGRRGIILSGIGFLTIIFLMTWVA